MVVLKRPRPSPLLLDSLGSLPKEHVKQEIGEMGVLSFSYAFLYTRNKEKKRKRKGIAWLIFGLSLLSPGHFFA